MGILVKDKVQASVDSKLLLNPYADLYISFQGNVNCRRINFNQTFRFTGFACVIHVSDYKDRHSKNCSIECIPISIATPNREEGWTLLYAELKKKFQNVVDVSEEDML